MSLGIRLWCCLLGNFPPSPRLDVFDLVSFDCVFVMCTFLGGFLPLNRSKEVYWSDGFSLHVTKISSVWNNQRESLFYV